jgi:hypothetical protein
MLSTPSARRRRLAALAAVATITVLGLTACVGSPTASPSSSASASESASSSATPTSATPTTGPTPTATAGTQAQSVTIACGTLVSAQTMYNFNPNFGLDSTFRPAGGTPAATAVADQGVACNWTNQSSGDTVTIAAVRPGSVALATLKAAAAGGTPVSGLGESAYFASSGGRGRVDAFTGAYWVVATSVFFSTGADAKDLVSAALSQLR